MQKNKFYWMRLYTDFFENPSIIHIRSLKDSDFYIVTLLKMSLMSVKYDGKLRVSDSMSYTKESLSKALGVKPTKLIKAIALFQELDLISIDDEESLIMNGVIDATGSETPSAERKRRQRERELKEELQSDGQYKSKSYKKDRSNEGKDNVAPYIWLNPDEYKSLTESYDNDIVDETIAELSEYVAMKGIYYENHFLVIKKWIKEKDDPFE
jgi:predicted phage replisome organizer